jgi:hypothetical protein
MYSLQRNKKTQECGKYSKKTGRAKKKEREKEKHFETI